MRQAINLPSQIDPTYSHEEIEAKEDYALAFYLSEMHNDTAPIGWGSYIPLAQAIIRFYSMRRGT